jgi:hypothetical protein
MGSSQLEEKIMSIATAILALTLPLLAACSEHPAMTQQKTTSKYVAPYSVAAPAVVQKETTTTTTVHPVD